MAERNVSLFSLDFLIKVLVYRFYVLSYMKRLRFQYTCDSGGIYAMSNKPVMYVIFSRNWLA